METIETTAKSDGTRALVVTAVVWGIVAVVVVGAYSNARDRIGAGNPSAIQIQQVNSDAMLQIAVAVALAIGASCVAIMARLKGR